MKIIVEPTFEDAGIYDLARMIVIKFPNSVKVATVVPDCDIKNEGQRAKQLTEPELRRIYESTSWPGGAPDWQSFYMSAMRVLNVLAENNQEQ